MILSRLGQGKSRAVHARRLSGAGQHTLLAANVMIQHRQRPPLQRRRDTPFFQHSARHKFSRWRGERHPGDRTGASARPGGASRHACGAQFAVRRWLVATLRVRRSDDGRLAEFRVPYRKSMRVLHALKWVAENEAADLAYRWFCGSKMCGTCAVRMNGREVLACWEAVEPEHDDRAAAQPAGDPRSRRRPRTVRAQGRTRSSPGSSGRRRTRAFPSRSATRT